MGDRDLDEMGETRVGTVRKDRIDVYVGRGSKWGNPFVRPGAAQRSKYPVREVEDPIAAYEAHVRASPDLINALPELRGNVLGCFCVRLGAPMPARGEERCHAQVLVRLVEEFTCDGCDPHPVHFVPDEAERDRANPRCRCTEMMRCDACLEAQHEEEQFAADRDRARELYEQAGKPVPEWAR